MSQEQLSIRVNFALMYVLCLINELNPKLKALEAQPEAQSTFEKSFIEQTP